MEKNATQPVKIDQKIKGYSVVMPGDKDSPPAPPPPVVLPIKPHERPDVVVGSTYRIDPPTMRSKMYVTINDIILDDGTRRPIEIFVNTKNVEHYQWMVALTRVISALFRKPGEFLFIVEELEQVFDPTGGYWSGNRMMPSVVAHIGAVLKQHCRDIGLLDTKPQFSPEQQAMIDEKKAAAETAGVKGQRCGACGENAAVLIDNCLTCTACGESKCG